MKKENKKKNIVNKINKKRLCIFVGIAILLLIIIIVSASLIINGKDKSSKKAGGNNTTQKKPEQVVKDNIYNNYLIAYIAEGDVQIGEGTLRVEGSPDVYYAVTDPLLKDIHTIKDINDLIDDTLLGTAAVRAKKLLESEYANQYTYNNETLYVKKTTATCNIMEGNPIEKEKIEYRNNEDKTYGVYQNIPYQLFEDEEDKTLKSGVLWFTCSKAFAATKTGKEDKYNPNAVVEDKPEAENTPTENEKEEN